jgi:hypothetical protein
MAAPQERRDFLPVPDPTTLTGEALERAVSASQTLLDSKISALKELHHLLEKRADGVATELDRQFRHADELSKGRKEAMDRDIDAVRALIETAERSTQEKFNSQAALTKQAQDSSQLAINAALASANNQISMLTQSLSDIRLGARESEGAKTGSAQMIAYMIALASVIGGLLIAGLGVFIHSSGH